MELNLKRPLVVFDLESTGLNITEDKIIELSYVKVFPGGKEESHTYRFNPHTLKYEKVFVSLRERVRRILEGR